MTCRFVVESPFQLLMAVEAASHHQIEAPSRQLVVLWPGEPTNRSQIQKLLTEFDWASIVEAPARRPSAHVARSRFVRRLAQDGGIEALFIGDHESPLMRHLANRGDHGELHLLDDGLRTVAVHEARSTGRRTDARSASERAVRGLSAAALRLDVRPPGPLDYFTVFDLDPTGADTVTRNEMARLRSRVEDAPVDPDLTLFLGGPAPEHGWMSEDTYIDAVRSVRDDRAGRLLYAPHRRESRDKLARLQRELSVMITDAPGPIEWEITRFTSRPGAVVSHLSSALITLPLVTGADVEVISLSFPDRLLAPKWRPVADRAHQVLTTQSRGRVTVQEVTH